MPLDPAPANAPTSPLREIWEAGRSALLRVAHERPEQLCLALAAASGVTDISTRLVVHGGGRPSLMQLGLWLGVMAPIWGIGRVYVVAYTVFLAGRPLGGQASHAEVRRAVAWSTLPGLALLVLWASAFLLIGRDLFAYHAYGAQGQSVSPLPGLLAGVAVLVVIGAELFYLDENVATVQKFSRRRALLNIVLGAVLASLVAVVAIYLWIEVRAFEHAGAGA
jgi:hypothetical protein